jgi:hypothetical protein
MSRVVELVCLANSRKQGGRCVAGLDLESGAWIRPVGPGEHGELDLSDCQLDSGDLPALLDVIRVPLLEPVPEPHQPENWLVGPGRWTLAGRMTVEDARTTLESARVAGPELFGDRSDRIDWDEIQARPVTSSLALIRVAAPTFMVNPWQSFRARFALNGAWYDLGYTDLSAWAAEARQAAPFQAEGDWYLTISLGEPYVRDNQCYKLAAAALPAL